MTLLDDFLLNLEKLDLTEIIRLQNQISNTLTQRFGKYVALASSDIVGSTSYFAHFGDEAGRRLQQQHFDFLAQAIEKTDGQFIDMVGDSALMVYPTVESAIRHALEFKRIVQKSNYDLPPEKKWASRIGIHSGIVLTDGVIYSGDSINICVKISSTAQAGAIRLSKTAFSELPNLLRLACRNIGTITLPSTLLSIEVVDLVWQDLLLIPSVLFIEETGTKYILPEQPVVSFGRMATIEGSKANDIILEHPDPYSSKLISRWHFEVLQAAEGLVLHVLSDKLTEVDGHVVASGEYVPIRIGSRVRVAGVLTIRFLANMESLNSMETIIVENL